MSNTKIEDVAHLYLGCKGQAMVKELHIETGQEKTVFLPLLRTLVGIEESTGKRNLIWKGEFISINRTKPILLPLSYLGKVEKMVIDTAVLSILPDEYESIPIYNLNAFIGAEYTKILLSKHYDLFGLIEAVEAIDATTLPDNPYTNV